MPTERPRIQVTLDDETSGLLSTLADKQNRSVSAIAADLIREALELNEDQYLSQIADQRYETTQQSGQWVSHEDAWK